MNEKVVYQNFEAFYSFYLGEHANRTSRRLHFVGTSLGLVFLATALLTHNWWLILIGLVQGYAFAWIGHAFFERNRPATFKYPRLSFMGDWRLWWDMLTGRIKF